MCINQWAYTLLGPEESFKLREGWGDRKSLVGRYICTSEIIKFKKWQGWNEWANCFSTNKCNSLCSWRSLALLTKDTISLVWLAAALKRPRPLVLSCALVPRWGTAVAKRWSKYWARSSPSERRKDTKFLLFCLMDNGINIFKQIDLIAYSCMNLHTEPNSKITIEQ